MYTVTDRNKILHIKILGPGRNKNLVRAFTILSSEDETKSMWGQINYEVHISELISNLADAQKAVFIRRLS